MRGKRLQQRILRTRTWRLSQQPQLVDSVADVAEAAGTVLVEGEAHVRYLRRKVEQRRVNEH